MGNCCDSTSRYFGQVQQHIKPYDGTFVAVEGSNLTHKLTMYPSVRIPYQQVLTSRITLRAGQTNYLLNHLGLGDNATFITIVANYDERSKFEADNFVNYSYYSDKSKLYSFSHILTLSGNSENRIEQLYLTNPNQNTPVILEVMVAIIDEYYTFFEENAPEDSSSVTFNNLKFTDIVSWDSDSNDIIAILNSFDQPICYIDIDDINSVSREGKVVIIDDTSSGQIYLDFINEYNAIQGAARISWMIENRRGTDGLNPPEDDYEPIITFTNNVSLSGYIPYGALTSRDGTNFTAQAINLSANGNVISKQFIRNYVVTKVIDYLDGEITITDDNIIIKNLNGTELDIIFVADTYHIYFDITDLANNSVRDTLNVKIVVE